MGFIAGGINTLAGGGSNLSLPMLMIMGLPADIANATNRVAVLMQCLVGVAVFDQNQMLDRPAVRPILIPTLAGGAAGALTAAYLPNLYLKPIMLIALLGMSLLILLRPGVIAPPANTPTLSPNEKLGAWWGLFAAGMYGGFVQAGVGFILLAALAGGLRYDLVRANALKMVCTLAFTFVSVAIFIIFDLIEWIPGLILAGGNMVGTYLTVKVAVRSSQTTLKWALFIITLIAVGAVLTLGESNPS
ncbi:MAG: sulfite exporter TauE/SafE family protein [Pseudomonadota bacterium]|nr:sulfite exporter TauE/SafE family protein [Pseudomonadota bacterium]MEC8409179.1 sulfite exporter TauE/SafE family protein [Pseudomonadota bacterium]